MAILMFIDGVMRSHTRAPIPQGIKLYKMLKANTQVFVLCKDKEKDDRWLREQKINLVDDLVGSDIPMAGDWPELRQVEHCRGRGHIDYVVTADPQLAAKLLESGVTSVMFLHPTYLDEKFRPDGREGKKSWKQIQDEIVRQQEMYVSDPRV